MLVSLEFETGVTEDIFATLEGNCANYAQKRLKIDEEDGKVLSKDVICAFSHSHTCNLFPFLMSRWWI